MGLLIKVIMVMLGDTSAVSLTTALSLCQHQVFLPPGSALALRHFQCDFVSVASM